MYVEVAFPLPVRQEFTYSVPKELQKEIQLGVGVLAPLGKKVASGIVTKIVSRVAMETKPIQQINSLGPLLSPQLLQLTRWVSDYYFCSWGEAIRAALPGEILSRPEVWLQALSEDTGNSNSLSRESRTIFEYLQTKSPAKVRLSIIKKKFRMPELSAGLKELEREGLVELSYTARDLKVKAKREKFVTLISEPEVLSQKDVQWWELLRARGTLSLKELKKVYPNSTRKLKKLEEKGFIAMEEREIFQEPWHGQVKPNRKIVELTGEQKEALKCIQSGISRKEFSPFLLFGVTGSGKTEVYIRAAQAALEQGKSVLVLVPEISLTVQTILSFKSAFPDKIMEIHSGLSPQARLEAWRKIKSREFRVVIGVRSAIFAPVDNLGLIIVDEEHDNSYKQSDPAPRYNARDLALVRGKIEKAAVVLGSATPSVESYYNAANGKYTLLTLGQRVLDRAMPQVEIIDLRQERKNGNYDYLSCALKEKVRDSLEVKKQAIIFLNRRGYSNLIKCQDCGYVPICRNCNLTLTFHLQGLWLRCHFCGYQKKAPGSCPACQSLKFNYSGAGTQRVESELKKLCGDESVRRLDSDVSSQKNYTRNILLDFQAGKFPLLLGTQMVTKGYDFPEVTLVGVISADVSLELPDFRASERTFQLLTQVAGRSGRGEIPGEVILQTYHPHDYAIQLASRQDYPEFYRQELGLRRELHYPPFCHLILILLTGVNLKDVQAESERLKESLLKSNVKGVFSVLGPAPAPLEKIRRKYRYRVMLKTGKVLEALTILEKVLQEGKFTAQREPRIKVDVDPQDLL